MQIKCLLYGADIKDDIVEAFKVQSFLGSYCKMCWICATDNEIFLPSFHLLRSETLVATRTFLQREKWCSLDVFMAYYTKGGGSFPSEPHSFSAVEYC